jgi:hypothetical protein
MSILLLCWHSWGFAEVPVHFFLEGGLHRASIDGDALWSDVEVFESELDLDSTLGLEDVNGLFGKAGILLYRRHELVVDYRRYSLSEDTTLSSSIGFEDIDFSANLPISPSLTFQTIGLFYGFRLIDLDKGFLSVRPGVQFVNYEVGIKANLFIFEWESSTYSGDVAVPFLLLAGEVKLHPMISLIGEFSGGIRDEQSAYLIQPALKVNFHPNISAFLGYSQMWFEDDTDDENHFEVTLSGLVVGAQFIW